MATYNSPGNYVIEKDFSEYPPSVNSSIAGVVGFAARGPKNKATLITSAAQLLRTFGSPADTTGGQGLLGALEILTRTNSIYYVRAVTSAGLEASGAIPIGVCPAVYVTSYMGTAASSIFISTTGADGTNSTPLGAAKHTLSVAASSLTTPNAKTIVQAVAKATSLDFPYTFVLNDADATHQSGWFVGTEAGRDAIITVSGQGFDFKEVSVSSGEPLGAAAARVITASGGEFLNTFAGGTYFVNSLYEGKGYNYSNVTNVEGTTTKGLQVIVDSKAGARFDLKVYDAGALEESFSMEMASGTSLSPEEVLKNSDNEKSSEFIKAQFRNVTNAAGETWVLGNKWHNKVTAVATVTNHHGVQSTTSTPRFIKLKDGTYSTLGGKNGDQGDNAGSFGVDERAAVIGTAAGKDGVHALNMDAVDISMACVPAIDDETVQNELISLAESTQNFLAVVSPSYGMSTAQEAINWHNGVGVGRTAAINSSYAAIYWPWVKSFDVNSKVDTWIDPAVFAIATMCYTDAKADPWFAPAGLTRGKLTRPFDVEVNLNQGDRDALYQPGNAVNPIAKFAQDGIVIWGQKTAQRTPSALDRINVRRMMIVIRKLILASTRTFMFEPNDPITWSKIVNVLEPAIDDIRRRRGITEFRVVCDETTNTPVRVDRNEMWCRVLIRPTKTAETLIFEVNLTNQSADLGAI